MNGQNVQGINKIFDEVIQRHNIKNDSQLSYFLLVAPPIISKHRHGHLPIGDSMILRLHERGGLPVAYIRKLLKEGK